MVWAKPGRARGRTGGAKPKDGAAEALRRVEGWQDRLEQGWTRADIATDEGLSRARVTQLFRLLELDPDLRRDLVDGRSLMTIRAALRTVTGEA